MPTENYYRNAPSIIQSNIAAPSYFVCFAFAFGNPPHATADADFVTANKTVFFPLFQELMLDLLLTQFPGLDEQYKCFEKLHPNTQCMSFRFGYSALCIWL